METSLLSEALSRSFQDLYTVVSGFGEEQFQRVPFEGSWSPVQVVEHIIKFTSGIPDQRTGVTLRPYDEKVETISQLFLNFSIRMKSPEFVQPGDPHRSKAEALQMLRDAQGRLEGRVKTGDLTLTCLDIELPVFGHLTRYEWIQFMVVHIQRHTHQLKNMLWPAGMPQ